MNFHPEYQARILKGVDKGFKNEFNKIGIMIGSQKKSLDTVHLPTRFSLEWPQKTILMRISRS